MGREREGTDKHRHVGVRERKKEVNVESANVCVRAPQQPGSPSAIRVVLQEQGIRLEERWRERERIVHELHDTLLQGFLGASMLLDQAVEQTPADSPCKPALRGYTKINVQINSC